MSNSNTNSSQRSNELTNIRELLLQRKELAHDIQTLAQDCDASATAIGRNEDLEGFAQKLQDDINQMQIIKGSLELERKERLQRRESDGLRAPLMSPPNNNTIMQASSSSAAEDFSLDADIAGGTSSSAAVTPERGRSTRVAAPSATLTDDDGAVSVQIKNDELFAQAMQEEWERKNQESFTGGAGVGEEENNYQFNVGHDQRPSNARGNGNQDSAVGMSATTRENDGDGSTTPSFHASESEWSQEAMLYQSPAVEVTAADAAGAASTTENEEAGEGDDTANQIESDALLARAMGEGLDDNDDSFSEGEDELVEEDDDEDVASDLAIARAVETSEIEIARENSDQGIIHYDKVFELCCFLCRCENQEHEKQIKEVLPFTNGSSSSSYYVRVHRECCKSLRRFIDGDYAVSDYGIAMATSPTNKKRAVFKADKAFLAKSKKTADNLRKAYLNNPLYQDPLAFRCTDERYQKNMIYFNTAKQRATSEGRKAANVLSLFCGIGAGILVLKDRLGIAINNCIVVEHDPVAGAVCAGNHKAGVANYVWIETFEELLERLDEIMEKYGPINIVEGGPPCTEFSAVNANRTGMDSTKGKYMLEFAKLVNNIKNHRLQRNESVFFLCENVNAEWKDQQQFEPTFGISPIIIDAQQLSPARRLRAYFTNLPVNELPDRNSKAASSLVTLGEGWMDPAQLHCLLKEEKPDSKAYLFMASEGRIDDKRMIKVRRGQHEGIETSYYSVADRESLMGFPASYVEPFVDQIFEKICSSFHSEDWFENALDNEWNVEDLARFSACNYKFACSDKDQIVKAKIGTVEKNKRGKPLYYFDSEGYCKRLLGNSYSIPVVEHLLRPVKDLFLQGENSDEVYSYIWG